MERILTGEYAQEVQQTIETIEFFHDIRLPVSWQRMFRAMLHPDHEQRAPPQQLHQLMGQAVRDMDNFLFKDLVPLSKAKLLPSSSSFLPA